MIGSNAVGRPSIFVIANNEDKIILKELLAGIEEEGIPYDVKSVDFTEETMLRDLHTAAQRSRMGISVGMLGNRVILQYSKLKEEKPLMDIIINSYHREKARIVGANAARLYKVMPFKELKNDSDELVDSVRAAVISVLSQLKVI